MAIEILVDLENIILPPLHTKSGFIKQFVKRMDRNTLKRCPYLTTQFFCMSEAMFYEDIFVGILIRFSMNDS